MGTRSVYAPPTTLMTENDTTDIFISATPWMSAANIEKVRAAFEIEEVIGNLDVVPAYQVADFADNPGSSTSVGTATNAAGYQDQGAYSDASSDTSSKRLIRFGWHIHRNSGTTPVACRASARWQIVTL